MAELVDALVSNTSGSNAVPVRSRLRVLLKPLTKQIVRGFVVYGIQMGYKTHILQLIFIQTEK